MAIDKETNLIWIDLEMTGLNPDTDRIIEMAVIVTDVNLNVLAEAPVIAVHQKDIVLNAMDEWNTRQHGQSGLVERVRRSRISEADAEATMLEFLSRFVDPRASAAGQTTAWNKPNPSPVCSIATWSPTWAVGRCSRSPGRA